MNQPDIADAVAERALVRAATGLGFAGVAFGVLALAFLVLAGGSMGARSLPQLVLLGLANLICLFTSAACYRRVPAVRAGSSDGPGEAAAASRLVSRAMQVLLVGELLAATLLLAFVRPFDVTVVSVLLALAVAAQAGIVSISLRGVLRRAARPRGQWPLRPAHPGDE